MMTWLAKRGSRTERVECQKDELYAYIELTKRKVTSTKGDSEPGAKTKEK